MLTQQQVNDARQQLKITNPGAQPTTTDWSAPGSFDIKETQQNQSESNDSTTQGTVPMNWGKVISDTWNTYKNAPQDIAEAMNTAANRSDIPGIGKSNNTTVRVGETALAATAGVLNTIFAPFGAAANEFANSIAKSIEKNPDIINSPAMGHVADFVQGASNHIQKLVQDNPRAAQDLGNALTVAATAVSGEEGQKLGLTSGPGLDANIPNPIPAIKEVAKATGGAIKGAAETVGNIGKDIGENISSKIKGGTPEEVAVNAVNPKLTNKAAALEYIKNPEGATEAGFIKGGKAPIPAESQRLARAIPDLLTSKDDLTNLKNLSGGMKDAEANIQKLDTTPLDKITVKNSLSEVQKNIPQDFRTIKGETKAFNNVFKFGDSLIENAPESETATDLRRSFDAQAKKEYPRAYKNGKIDTSTPQGNAIKLWRDTVNAHAYDAAGEGSDLQKLINRQADIYRAMKIVGTKTVGSNATSMIEDIENTLSVPMKVLRKFSPF